MRRSIAWVVMVMLLVSAWPAFAKPSREAKRRAARMAREAIDLYKRGDLVQAGNLFLEAYEISEHSVQLRNAAKALEEADELQRAQELWRRYRDLPDISDDERREAEAHVQLVRQRQIAEAARGSAAEAEKAALRAETEARLARERADKALTPLDARPPDAKKRVTAPPAPRDHGLAYAGVGVGAALLITSAVLFASASSRTHDLDRDLAVVNRNGLIVGVGPADVDDRVGRINGERIGAGVTVTLGVAVLAGSLAWFWWPQADGEESAMTASPTGPMLSFQ